MPFSTLHGLFSILLAIVLTALALDSQWPAQRRKLTILGGLACLGIALLVVHTLVLVAMFADLDSGHWLRPLLFLPLAPLALVARLTLARGITKRPRGWLAANLVVTLIMTVAIGLLAAFSNALGHMH